MELARLVLQILKEGQSVSVDGALQLRNWSATPEDSMLPLDQIALRISSGRGNPKSSLGLKFRKSVGDSANVSLLSTGQGLENLDGFMLLFTTSIPVRSSISFIPISCFHSTF
jgi:hypothetical protein